MLTLAGILGAAWTALCELAWQHISLAQPLFDPWSRWMFQITNFWNSALQSYGLEPRQQHASAYTVAACLALIGIAVLLFSPASPKSAQSGATNTSRGSTVMSKVVFAGLVVLFAMGRQAVNAPNTFPEINMSFNGVIAIAAAYFAASLIGGRAFHVRAGWIAPVLALMLAANWFLLPR